jgi:sulfide:quinone oxidoreductase
MGSLIPKGVHWIKSAVAAFEPKDNASSSMAAAW